MSLNIFFRTTRRRWRPSVRGHQVRTFAGEWNSKGHDLLGESLYSDDGSAMPRVILDGYSPSGFDVVNVIEKTAVGVSTTKKGNEEEEESSGELHMAGNVMCFPHGCFLWNVPSVNEITPESLSPAILYRPRLKYLFIGSEEPMDPNKLQQLKKEMKERENISVEQLDIVNAIGTFNILNAEDRPTACALIKPAEPEES